MSTEHDDSPNGGSEPIGLPELGDGPEPHSPLPVTVPAPQAAAAAQRESPETIRMPRVPARSARPGVLAVTLVFALISAACIAWLVLS